MRVLWRSVSLLIFLGQLATCQRPFGGKSAVTKVMVSMVQLEQVKARILRGLNMTAAPHKSPPTTRMLTPDSSKAKGKMPQDRNEKQPDIAMVFSESAADEKVGTLTFKLDSKIREQLDQIEVALLVVRLRYCPNAWDRGSLNETGSVRLDNTTGPGTAQICGKHARRGQARQNIVKAIGDNQATNETADFSENKLGGNTNKGRANKLRPDGKSRKARGLKTWRVKVVVKVVDAGSSRTRRMAVEKVSVRKTSTMAVTVSKEVLAKAALSTNHALLIQMTCKRCQGRVQIENVYNNGVPPSKNSRRKPRLNPNRPYLFIKTRSSNPAPESAGGLRVDKPGSANELLSNRLRRSNSGSSPARDNSVGLLGPPTLHCCPQTYEVNFQKAGLDFIIYPKTFTVAHRVRSCRASRAKSSRTSTEMMPLQKNYGSRLTDLSECSSSRETSQAEPTSASPRSSNREAIPWTDIPRRTVSSTKGRCVEIVINPRPLSVVYLNDSNMAETGTFERMVDETCECR